MRTFVYEPNASPRAWGRAHGEAWRYEIQALAEIREWLTVQIGAFESVEQVLAAAREHLPVLERFDADLYEELLGIAEGADVPPERIVVLNHYTDLRDLRQGEVSGDEGCSVVHVMTDEGPVLGQTWDMHISALPYVMMLGVPAVEGRPAVWTLSLVGCLGMAGLNTEGVGVCINNLRSLDAKVGVVWPALVRRALAETTAAGARDVLLGAPVGSGHHYLVADGEEAYGIETSGTHRKVIWEGDPKTYVHTNHCLDDEVGACSTVAPESSTHERYDRLTGSLKARPPKTTLDLWGHLASHEGYPRSVCSNLSTPERPHGSATCSAILMNLAERRVFGLDGIIHGRPPIELPFERLSEH